MAKGLKFKIAFNFGLPLVIALSHAYFYIISIYEIDGDNESNTDIYSNGTIYLYVCHFAITAYNHSKRTIRHSI